MSAARSDPRWGEVSLFPPRRGVPWWGAVPLALGVTALGVFLDLERINRLGLVFQAAYFVGCLAAVAWVQRRGLFGPMVQPPLILAVAVPGVVLASSGAPDSGGLTAKALAVATPLINGFPTMAITTGATLAIGFLRLAVQRPPRAPARRSEESAASQSGTRGSNRPTPQ